MSAGLAILLDESAATYVALGMDWVIGQIGARGDMCPPAVIELRAMAIAIAKGRQETTEATQGDSRLTPVEDAPMPEWLTAAQVAELVGLSERTVQRRVADGSLPSKTFGRARRVHRDQVSAA